MSHPFDDPHYAPPADLSRDEKRAYEEAVLRGVTEAIRPGRYGPLMIESIDLEGQWPDTAVVFTFNEATSPDRRLVSRAPIWDDLVVEVRGRRMLDSAPSVGGHIFSAFTAGELESREAS